MEFSHKSDGYIRQLMANERYSVYRLHKWTEAVSYSGHSSIGKWCVKFNSVGKCQRDRDIRSAKKNTKYTVRFHVFLILTPHISTHVIGQVPFFESTSGLYKESIIIKVMQALWKLSNVQYFAKIDDFNLTCFKNMYMTDRSSVWSKMRRRL